MGAGTEVDSESINDSAKAVSDWLADGTKEQEPVTTATPEEEKPAAVVEPVVEEEVVVETPAAAGTTEPVEEVAPVETDFLTDEMLDRKVLLKRGDETEEVTVRELRKRGMLQSDYSKKTAEVSQQRRDLEDQLAEFDEQQALFKRQQERATAEQERMKEIRGDPDKWEAYQEHLERYRTDEQYRQVVDKAMRADQLEDEKEILEMRQFNEASKQAAKEAQGWIDEMAPEFAGVDPKRVRAIYSNALEYQGVSLDKRVVRAIYRQEMDAVAAAQTPLRVELDELKAVVAKLKGEESADAHNADTRKAIKRTKTVTTKPHGSASGHDDEAPKRFHMNELQDKVSEWVKAGSGS